jgi:hypothetical protein
MTPCEDTIDDSTTWCCGTGNRACCGTDAAIKFPNISTPFLPPNSSSVQTVASSSSALITSTPTSTTLQPHCKKSQFGEGIGIGVAIAAGVFGLLVLVYGLGIRRRRRINGVVSATQEKGPFQEASELPGHEPVEMYSTK